MTGALREDPRLQSPPLVTPSLLSSPKAFVGQQQCCSSHCAHTVHRLVLIQATPATSSPGREALGEAPFSTREELWL